MMDLFNRLQLQRQPTRRSKAVLPRTTLTLKLTNSLLPSREAKDHALSATLRKAVRFSASFLLVARSQLEDLLTLWLKPRNLWSRAIAKTRLITISATIASSWKINTYWLAVSIIQSLLALDKITLHIHMNHRATQLTVSRYSMQTFKIDHR